MVPRCICDMRDSSKVQSQEQQKRLKARDFRVSKNKLTSSFSFQRPHVFHPIATCHRRCSSAECAYTSFRAVAYLLTTLLWLDGSSALCLSVTLVVFVCR
ncbi:hypothetical protein M011DRAFT_217601 [Sporormia fimetaria CBS 119925]|uniref:Uncharacterized protein n=1 Tax=Sporormia fimetaria CBS 119925 TaxID=1340428 RepID=A0A6A6V1L4_9PLEO|nr:hypothetical protein M011DRAFT_217601 [Sporormia fimetaria CBS 119925]